MQPKTILIAGATGAIGAATAKIFAAQGANVVLIARSKQKAELLKNDILFSNPEASVSIMEADLTDFDSLKKLAGDFTAEHNQLDLFVNSTAIFKEKETLLSNGIEETFAANYLGYFLLTNLLTDAMKKSENALVLNIVPPTGAKIAFDNIQKLKKYSGLKSFNNSSVCKAVFTVELARKMAGTSVSTVNFNPGFVKNQGQKLVPGVLGFILRSAASLFAVEPEITSKIILKLVTDFTADKWNGKFLNNKLADKTIKYQTETEVGKRLWDESNHLLGTQF